MAGRLEAFQRPQGFPFSEEEFHEFKQKQMRRIVHGGMQQYYDEWVLRGTPGETYHPTVALGIFPTVVVNDQGYMFEHEVTVLDINHRPLDEYWRDASSLPLTERVSQYEALYFSHLQDKKQEVFDGYVRVCLENILPSGIFLFSRPQPGGKEFAYMVSPRFVPPSVTYRHLIEQARLEITQA